MNARSTEVDVAQIVAVLEDTRLTLKSIKESPALNGGFDSLMSKVDVIQESQSALKENQGKLTEKVDAIHDAMYEPDHGVYARIKDAAKAQEVEIVITDVAALKLWKTDLETFKKDMVTFFKRLGIAFVGAVFSVVCKLAYDFASGHIHYK